MTASPLARAATRSAAVFGSSNVAGYAISFVGTIALARFVTPGELGQALLATAIADCLIVVLSLNLPTSLVREPEATATIAFVTALRVLAGVAAAAGVVAALIIAVLLALGNDLVAKLFAAVLIGRVLYLLALVLGADLQRRFAFGAYSAVLLAAQVGSNAAAVGLGAAGAGSWAIVGREAVTTAMTLVAFAWLNRWSSNEMPDRRKARDLVSSGWKLNVSQLGDLLFHRLDNLVVGVIAGARQLGLYGQAYVVAEVGSKASSPVLATVPFAAYARLQGDSARTQRMYDLIGFFLTRAVMPILPIMFLLPGDIIVTVFGPDWASAADMLRALAVYAVLIPTFEHARALLIANGEIERVIRVRVIQVTAFIPALLLMVVLAGGTGAAIAVGFAISLGLLLILRASSHIARFSARDNLRPPLFAVFPAAAVCYLVGAAFDGHLISLLVASAATVSVYSLALYALDRPALHRNLKTLRGSLSVPRQDSPDTR